MSITGAGDADGGSPTKVGVAISDVLTGMLGAVGLLGALAGREREAGPASGEGQRVDVSILGATLASLVNQAQNAFVSGAAPGRLGNAHPNIVPYETFETSDGADRRGGRVGAAMAASVRGARPARARRGSTIRDQRRPGREPRGSSARCLRQRFAGRTTATWIMALEAAGIPCGPINDVLEAFASPEAVALGMTVDQEHPAFGLIRQVGLPFQLSTTPASIRMSPPTLGAGLRSHPGRARLRPDRDRGAPRPRGRSEASPACRPARTHVRELSHPLVDSAALDGHVLDTLEAPE